MKFFIPLLPLTENDWKPIFKKAAIQNKPLVGKVTIKLTFLSGGERVSDLRSWTEYVLEEADKSCWAIGTSLARIRSKVEISENEGTKVTVEQCP